MLSSKLFDFKGQLAIVNDAVIQTKGYVTHYYEIDLPMSFYFLGECIIKLKGSPD